MLRWFFGLSFKGKGMVLLVIWAFVNIYGPVYLGALDKLAASLNDTGIKPPAKVTPLAKREIPARYLALYQQAGKKYGVPWTVLAGIGKVESDHGRSRLPGVRSGANPYGACGPMQIGCVPGSKAGNSWARYGHGRPYDPDNAIPAAARYLIGHGAKRNLDRAIYGYNHSWSYVRTVKAWAHRYRTGRLS